MMNEAKKRCDPQLQYAFLSSIGEKLVGVPEGPFAIYSEERKAFLLIGIEDAELVHASLTGNMADLPMAVAQFYEASFSVNEGVVTCSLKGFTETGASYPEAAMRTYLAFKEKCIS